MKQICMAAILITTASPAHPERGVIQEPQVLRNRLDRIEILQEAETAGFYFGGADACNYPLSVEDFSEVVPGPTPDPETYTAFMRGMVVANQKEALNLLLKTSFCEQLDAYMQENDF